jgi:hypothetical protein
VAQQTAYQGNRYSFTDISVEGETTQLYGSIQFAFPKGVLQSLNWSAEQDPGIVQGNQVGIVGRTNGYGVGTGEMSLLVSESDDWIVSITSQGFYPALSVYFNLRITYSINGIDVRSDRLDGVRLTKIGTDNAKGNDPTISTFPLSIARIYKAGVLLFGDPAT